MNADLDSHRIEGYVPSGERVSIPLISQVTDNLWTGGCVNGVILPESFDVVVSLYPWEKYKLPSGCQRYEFEMFDSDEGPERERVLEAARWVRSAIDNDVTVLVHCQAGLNRSALIAGTALILGGMEPGEAIALLRGKRSELVLCNKTFERWLLAFCPEQSPDSSQ